MTSYFAPTLFLSIVFVIFLLDIVQRGWKTTLICPFWIFSFFYVLAYPIKYIIIANEIPIQAPITPAPTLLDYSLLISLLFWFSIWLFYCIIRNLQIKQGKHSPIVPWKYSSNQNKNESLVIILVVVLISASGFHIYSMLSTINFNLVSFYIGNEQNEARFGAGLEFLVGCLYFPGFLIYLFLVKKKNIFFFAVIVIIVILIAFLDSILLTTRRPLYLAVYILLLYYFLTRKNNLSVIMLAAFPIISALAAPAAQLLRYSLNSIFENGLPTIDLEYALTSIGSTFEGIEYLARYIELTTPAQLLTGVDYGVSYSFNAFLALIPRSIWAAKPETYGSIAIQDFLYSTGHSVTTLPSGIVVDSLYGFGIIGCIVYSFIVATFLRLVESILFRKANIASSIQLVLAAYFYIYLFNFVRGGTGIIQGLVMLSAWVILANSLKLIRFGNKKDDLLFLHQ